MIFKVIKSQDKHLARRGELKTRRGVLQTPFFMTIATKAAVKSLSYEDLQALEVPILLSNTYHLMVRPGEKLVKKAGGLHEFMHWEKPILTDSGGFQVFSLSKIRKLEKAGVTFNSHLDGKKMFMRPEDSIQIQLDLDSDILMVLDECVALPAKKEYVEQSVELTTEWASRCRKYFDQATKRKKKPPLIFGIVQGGLEKDLRLKSAEALQDIGFDGYAIGGLSVGESESEMYKCLKYLTPALPADKPRYLMGVGKPENIINAVACGVDMFDCVIPTREARHGRLYLFNEKFKGDIFKNPKKVYEQINIRGEKFKTDLKPINAKSKSAVLRTYSRAYLRHLFNTDEPLAIHLATLNNVEFYLGLMEKIRKSI